MAKHGGIVLMSYEAQTGKRAKMQVCVSPRGASEFTKIEKARGNPVAALS